MKMPGKTINLTADVKRKRFFFSRGFILQATCFLLLFFNTLLNNSLFAQNPFLKHAYHIGNVNAGTIGYSIATDVLGNQYVTGAFTHTTDFDPGPGTANLQAFSSGAEIFLAKYTATGDYLWAFNISSVTGGYGNSVFVDAAGNVYITGIFSGTADFDPGPGSALFSASGTHDIFVAKYNTDGIYQWAFNLGGTERDEGYCITADASGNVIVTGEFRSQADFDPGPGVAFLTPGGQSDIFVAKYDASGNYIFAFNIGSTGQNIGCAVAADASGNVYVTGRFYSTADFDPGPGTTNLTAAGGYDLFVAKYSPAGIYQWAFKVGNIAGDVGYGISVDAAANVYITGEHQIGSDFDPGPGTAYRPGGAFIAKYTTNGEFLWANSIPTTGAGGNIGTAINTDASGNVYVTGYFYGPAVFNSVSGNITLPSLGLWDIYIAKYNTTGSCLWAFSIGGQNANSIDIGYGIATDNYNNIYVTGLFQASADFDPSAASYILTPYGGSDMFLAKYSPCQPLAPIGPVTGSTTVCPGTANTYSTPAVTGATSYTWSLPSGWTGSSLIESITVVAGTTGGVISVTANDACSAGTSQTLAVSVSHVLPASVTITANPSGPACMGTNITFAATPLNAGAAPSYQWKVNGINAGTNNRTFSSTAFNNGDIITVELTSDPVCGSPATVVSNAVAVSINSTAAPSINITASANDICPATTVTFTVVPSNAGATASYQWRLNNANVGTNSLTYNNTSLKNGDKVSCIMNIVTTCSASPYFYSDTITTIIRPVPEISFTPATATIALGSSVQLNAVINGAYINFLWTPSLGLNNPSTLDPIANPTVTTIYKLSVVTTNGCKAEKTLAVNVTKDIFIPNSFTPNGDSKNDIFRIPAGTALNLQYFHIYNRYGEIVFRTTDVNTGWNGMYNGVESPSGAYTYIIKGSDYKGEIFIKGSVIIIR